MGKKGKGIGKVTIPSFPCTQNFPLVTRPFCGLLIPPEYLKEVLKLSEELTRLVDNETEDLQLKPEKANDSFWFCWLCCQKNKKEEETCSLCLRPKEAEWLVTPSGGCFKVGSLVEIRQSKSNTHSIGLVTQIDYRQKCLLVHATTIPKVKTLKEEKLNDQNELAEIENERQIEEIEVPKQVVITQLELAQTKCILLDLKEEMKPEIGRARLMCDFLLCGRCGSVSRLSNGREALKSEAERADTRGRLRFLQEEIAEKEREVNMLNRKWRETKQGWDPMKLATTELHLLQRKAVRLENSLLPPQFWCPFCGWEWPRDRPYTIP